ncbi:hypothetical protein C8F01DRAFT_235602 [Mycena amicta]|nr:hypothetical protein C8F01DRAFT_235602 [Mycena amicta]
MSRTTNLQQRLRASAATTSYTAVATATSPSPPPIPSGNPNSNLSSALRWMALGYCFCSVVFSTATLYAFLSVQQQSPPSQLSISPLESLSSSQRWTGLATYLGTAIEPFLLSPVSIHSPDSLTACMWITDDEDDIHSFISLAGNWTGPISLVMTTTSIPESQGHQHLLARLGTLRQLDRLSLHLVHANKGQYLPSAYLNLARLFASSNVILFPGHPIEHVLTSNSFDSLNSLVPHPTRKPLFVSPDAMPPTGLHLTPVVLPRTAKIWCSERLSLFSSRVADWSECIWKISLEEYGLVDHISLNMSLNSRNETIPSSMTVSDFYQSNPSPDQPIPHSGFVTDSAADIALKFAREL